MFKLLNIVLNVHLNDRLSFSVFFNDQLIANNVFLGIPNSQWDKNPTSESLLNFDLLINEEQNL